ncbi:DUF817 domain-containing protein [Streptomyces sp. NPDC048290]|uniref:DUF817 domain-containing protein n=1 Tax=Streptomyces sp. NPDC048290 TaxID=3155811 RepID=UPI0034302B27
MRIPLIPRPLVRAARDLLLFAWLQARSCAFAVALLLGVAVSDVLPGLPLARYDLLLGYAVGLTVLFWALGWETTRDIAVIAVCHAVGLSFEIVKVALGSWSYPEPATLKLAGVPLYGGFLYAALGSYVCRSWHLMDLHLVGYRPRVTAAVATAVYLNFFTHHWLPDARGPLAALLLLALTGTTVHYTVGTRYLRMPLSLAFVLIGFFLWIAENLATFSGAWRYPHQLDGWEPVAFTKFGAWALLVSVTFVLAAVSRAGTPPPQPLQVPRAVTSPDS